LPDSWALAFALMERAGLAATPGRDFGSHDTARHIRFSTASAMTHLVEAARRLRQLWEGA
jgi:aspartate/methionine/tyrosine aminotransferase